MCACVCVKMHALNFKGAFHSLSSQRHKSYSSCWERAGFGRELKDAGFEHHLTLLWDWQFARDRCHGRGGYNIFTMIQFSRLFQYNKSLISIQSLLSSNCIGFWKDSVTFFFLGQKLAWISCWKATANVASQKLFWVDPVKGEAHAWSPCRVCPS